MDKDDVELQVAEIQRKYRIMEGSRRSYSEDSQATIRRQRATIEQLKADNTKLKEQLQLETKVRYISRRLQISTNIEIAISIVIPQ